MYHERFGLRTRPFPTAPDLASYYPAGEHERILVELIDAIELGDSPLIVTGQPGTGKTLLAHALLDRLETNHAIVFLTNGRLRKPRDLYQAVLYDLSLPFEGSDQELHLRLTDFLLSNFADGVPTLLILDEAQHTAPAVIEEIRLLGNLEVGQSKALHTLLIGQPALEETLALPACEAFAQRVGAHHVIRPLELDEAIDYLRHQIRVSGGQPEKILDDEAAEYLARASKGIPRLLNRAGHQALLVAHRADIDMVDVEVAMEAIAALGWNRPESNGKATQPLAPNHAA